MRDEVLRAENLRGRYIRKNVLNSFYFHVDRGTIVGLFGVNRCGKTTLMNLMTGNLEGQWHKDIFVEGERVWIENNLDAARAGIYAVRKKPSLLLDFTVAENLCLFTENWSFKKLERNMIRLATESLHHYGLDEVAANQRVGSYSITTILLLEMIRAKINCAKVIFLDCFSVFYMADELNRLFDAMERMKKEGVSFVILLNHWDENSIPALDKLVIMREGTRVKALLPHQFDSKTIHKLAADDYSGEEILEERSSRGAELLAIENMQIFGSHFSFRLYHGEILRIAVDAESNAEELLNTFRSGTIKCSGARFCGKAVRNTALGHIIQKNAYFLPKLSNQYVVFQNLSETENLTICAERYARGPLGIIRTDVNSVVETENRELLDQLRENNQEGIYSPVSNIQVVRTRMGLQKSRMLIVMNPFQGLDKETELQVYSSLRKITQDGGAVIILDRSIRRNRSLCDREIVLCSETTQ